MSSNKLGAAFIGFATLPLVAIGLMWLSSNSHLLDSTKAEPVLNLAPGSVGGSRSTYLTELTQLYVARKSGEISSGMKAGSELAPLPFLNRELEQRGMKWRVRTTEGLDADTYDIS